MDFSQYTQENQRVIQGMKDTLKALINKFGGTVDAEKIDQYPTLVDGIEVKGDAGDITYDNAESGLHSNNVQDAIDEVYKAQTSVIPENIVLSDDAELGEPFIADSDTLEGHPASYFAVAEETSAALNQKADLTFSNIVEKTTALENIGAMPKTYTGSDIPVSSEDSTKIKDALGNKADLTLSNLSDYQKALRNIGGRPNRNLLINHHMVGTGEPGSFPINQRGQKIYTPDWNQPSFDMWFCEANQELKVEIKDGFVTVTNTSSDRSLQFKQVLLPGLLKVGETYTLSAYVKDVSGEVLVYLSMTDPPYGGDIVFSPIANDISYRTITSLSQVSSGTWKVTFGLPPGSSISFADIKLEEGPIQTLGWKDGEGKVHLFEIPDYAEELAKCQRYLLKLKSNACWGYADFETLAYLQIPVPTSMRSTPVWSGSLPRLYPNDGNTVTGASVLSAADNNIVLMVDGTGFTPGKVYSANEIDGFLSAEYVR